MYALCFNGLIAFYLMFSGGGGRVGHLHCVLDILRVLVFGAGVHAGDVAGDEGQIVRVYPGAVAARRRPRQRQQVDDRRVLAADGRFS